MVSHTSVLKISVKMKLLYFSLNIFCLVKMFPSLTDVFIDPSSSWDLRVYLFAFMLMERVKKKKKKSTHVERCSFFCLLSCLNYNNNSSHHCALVCPLSNCPSSVRETMQKTMTTVKQVGPMLNVCIYKAGVLSSSLSANTQRDKFPSSLSGGQTW